MKITVKIRAKSNDQVLDAKISLMNAGWNCNTTIKKVGWFKRTWETTMYKYVCKRR